MELTLDQARVLREVVGSNDGGLVFAPPGAGKTTLALLCAREYVPRLGPHQKVCFLTFSNAAVDAISTRRTGLIAGTSRAKVEVTNFHQFALGILRAYGPAVGLGLPIQIVDSITKRYLDRMAHDDLLRRGYLSFQDFLPLTNAVFAANRSLRDTLAYRYPFVIVDEFQDTNEDQWDFVRNIGDQGQLLCLGDPDQMIYEFQGASPRRFEQFREARPNRIEITLDPHENSHRFATPRILETARSLRNGDELPDWMGQPDQPVEVQMYHNSAQAKAALVLYLLTNHKWGCGSTAILCRTNKLAEQVSRWLLDDSL